MFNETFSVIFKHRVHVCCCLDLGYNSLVAKLHRCVTTYGGLYYSSNVRCVHKSVGNLLPLSSLSSVVSHWFQLGLKKLGLRGQFRFFFKNLYKFSYFSFFSNFLIRNFFIFKIISIFKKFFRIFDVSNFWQFFLFFTYSHYSKCQIAQKLFNFDKKQHFH